VQVDDFAGEVLGLLASRSAEGMYWDWPGDTEVVLARKKIPAWLRGYGCGLSLLVED
jgi:hypothetical protein